MKKSIYISDNLYKKINEIAYSSKKEQMMVFGGRTIGDTIVVNNESFIHFNDKQLVNSDNDSIEIPMRLLKESMNEIRNKGYDTFIMTHSHLCKPNFLEFMYGDLSDEDEINSEKLRSACNMFGLDYYDGITTGKRIYFWSTNEEEKRPILMNCYVDNVPVEYNNLTQITEDLEHTFKL